MGIPIIFFKFLDEYIYCGDSLEAPQRGASNEYPQHMFSLRNKNGISIFWIKKSLICCYAYNICFSEEKRKKNIIRFWTFIVWNCEIASVLYIHMKHLDRNLVLTLSAWQTKPNTCANSVDPDEMSIRINTVILLLILD